MRSSLWKRGFAWKRRTGALDARRNREKAMGKCFCRALVCPWRRKYDARACRCVWNAALDEQLDVAHQHVEVDARSNKAASDVNAHGRIRRNQDHSVD